MSHPIMLGTSNFGKLIRASGAYADKSLLAKNIIEDGSEAILITRPRRWGKTLNMSMLQHFLSADVEGEATRGLFDQLNIAHVDQGAFLNKHQGRYPVIFVSFKDVKEDSFADAYQNVAELMSDLYAEHAILLTSNKLSSRDKKKFEAVLNETANQITVKAALYHLSKYLFLHYGTKPYILIDEYDTPLNFSFNKHHNYFEQMSSLMKNILSKALKDNRYLQKGVMTGIFRVSKESMLSDLNHLKVFTVLDDKFAQYFGFVEEELDLLFRDQGLSKDEARVKAWYNGYTVGGLTLYNPWSIMNSLQDGGKLCPYWVNTASDALLKTLLQEASLENKTLFQALLSGASVEVAVTERLRFDQVKDDNSMLWALLLFAGYLKVISAIQEHSIYRCQVAIPNEEIKSIYESIFLNWLKIDSPTITIKRLLEALVEGNVIVFAEEVSRFLKSAASIHDYSTQPEAFYHGFMLALTASLLEHYYVFSNAESGYGRPDLLIIPKDTQKTLAIILEFKHVPKNKTPEAIAKEALTQIDEKAYASKLAQFHYIQKICKLGIAFNGKEVNIALD